MKKIIAITALFALSASFQSIATTYTVDAFLNSTTGGTGILTSVVNGQAFTVSVNPLDLWSAGGLPRWSNANGIVGADLIATGSPDANGDDPGVAAGTVIGQDIFGAWTQNGLSAPFGTLVGQFGLGSFFNIGTNYTGVASDSTLKLFYFDSNNGDNAGSILANITSVPEPEAYIMVLVGLGIMGVVARRRRL